MAKVVAAASPSNLSKRQRYELLRGQLWSDRSTFDAHWQELASFLLPRRTRFWPGDRNRGDKRNQNIIDSTGRFAARTLQSGLHAGLTSPARPWFKLTTPDPDLAEFKPVEEWLELVTQRMYVIFADSNLYNTLPIVYGDMGVFGTAAMALLEDSKDLCRCYAYPIGSYALGLDSRGLVTTFVREYELTVLQVIETFGLKPGSRDIDWTKFTPAVKALWEGSNYQTPVQICWIITPNVEADKDRIGSHYLPWSSCHFELGTAGNPTIDSTAAQSTFLRDAGFQTFPIFAPRWDITGEDTYGTDCPGMTALGDVKQLQLQQRKKAQAINKMVDPPLVGPPELRSQKTSLLPGDITYVREPHTNSLRAIHEVGLNLEHLVRDMGETQYRIQRAFYEDLFLMLARSDDRLGADRPTAREIEERHEEKLLALGPVLERTNDELLDPMVDRAFMLMQQAGLLPEPPDELDGVTLKVEYVSIMAAAQKLVGVSAQDRFLQSVGGIAQFDPSALDKVDTHRAVANYARMLGVDPKLVRSDEEAQAIGQQRAQAQQQLNDAKTARDAAAAAHSASQTQMGTDSALDRIVAASAAGAAA